jgi:UDP-glucose 4-epimerase
MLMEILVTGGAGFIGSHITDRLIKEGHNVVIVDNLYSGKRENINPAADFVKMDIRDKEVEGVFKKNNFDAIFHLAAQMDVRKSIEDPFLDADINILGGINILQTAHTDLQNWRWNFILISIKTITDWTRRF